MLVSFPGGASLELGLVVIVVLVVLLEPDGGVVGWGYFVNGWVLLIAVVGLGLGLDSGALLVLLEGDVFLGLEVLVTGVIVAEPEQFTRIR